MSVIFFLFLIASFVFLLIGFFSPKTSLFYDRGERTRLKSFILYSVLTILFLKMFSASVETDTINSAEPQTSLSPVEVVPPSVATHKNLSTERSASNETPEFYSVGENINVANFSYRVNSIKFVKTVGNEYTRETADGIYLIVSLTFRNNDREEHTLDNSFFKLTDQTGIQFETSTEGETALEMSGQETLFLKQCNPQITKSGFLIFEVPDKRSYTLHLSGGFWSGKTGVVRITPK